MAMILSALLRQGGGPKYDAGEAPLEVEARYWRPKPLEEIVDQRERPGSGLIERTRELLTRNDLSPRERDDQIWQEVRRSDLPIADWRMQRWEEDPERRRKALDDLKGIARNPGRYTERPSTLAKWWAAGWEPDPGAWERAQPPHPPNRTVPQWVGWQTDPYADLRPPSAFGIGLRHGWAEFSEDQNESFARTAEQLGLDETRRRYLESAKSDRQRAQAHEADLWKYDPNGNIAWWTGDKLAYFGPKVVEAAILKNARRLPK